MELHATGQAPLARRCSTRIQHAASDRAVFGAGFTLPEYLITIAIVAVVSGAMLTAYIFGARMHVLASAKLNASDQARVVVGELAHAVRTANAFKIGEGTLTSFNAISPNELRKGSAIVIYPSSDTNAFVRYYLENGTLKRTTNDATATPLARWLTNTVVFTAEDPWGNVTSNERPFEVVGLLLQFNQTNGGTAASDFFQLQAKINKRTPMGYQN